MDIEGGVQTNINDSMAFGVDNAIVVCPFMTAKYFQSKNCKKELNYADTQDKEIVPIMAQADFKPEGWLGLITAGLLWIDFRNATNVDKSILSLEKELQHRCSGLELAKPISAQQKPKFKGRAFRNAKTGKFLAESGEMKTHQASGTRSTLVLRDAAEATSFWVEERDTNNKEIYFYKNFATNMYLGYDPNGDYIYTKAQHYGAEQWNLVADDESTNGERAVVLFACFGKKFLAVRNGKLTGVNKRDADCIWILD
ncbi:uncharacterized protein LOC142343901 isoform X2 [Convolutriloba macropyga]